MTSEEKENLEGEQLNFFFWLGEDGEMKSLTEKEFEEKQDEERERFRRWKDVDVITGEGVGG